MSTLTDQSALDLTVTGMTCTSCAARVERRLNKMPGVQATVNYATAVAHVEHSPDVTVDELGEVVLPMPGQHNVLNVQVQIQKREWMPLGELLKELDPGKGG